jgi:hypothetical protein
MLFHITMTHTPEDCPLYASEEVGVEFRAALADLSGALKTHEIDLRFLVNGAPEHVFHALLEAENMDSVVGFIRAFPLRQDFKVTAVRQIGVKST